MQKPIPPHPRKRTIATRSDSSIDEQKADPDQIAQDLAAFKAATEKRLKAIESQITNLEKRLEGTEEHLL